MSKGFTPRLECSEAFTLFAKRELPIPGRVKVSKGEKVESNSCVAETIFPGDLFIMRLPERMGLTALEVISGIKVKENDPINKGDLLCEHSGLFGLLKASFYAPLSGTVDFINKETGHLGIRGSSRELVINAHIDGVIEEVYENSGVLIRGRGAYFQGIFGVGGERCGVLTPLICNRDEIVTPKNLPTEIAGAVLVGGSQPSIETLLEAQERGAVGFITGSIDDTTLSQFVGYDIGIALTGNEPVTMTLIITEGFGVLPLSKRVYELSKRFKGLGASINGATQVRAGAMRPEVFISHNQDIKIDETVDDSLTVGQNIRVIRVPYFGVEGTIKDLPIDPELIETGAYTRVVKVSTSRGDIITVPRANIELI